MAYLGAQTLALFSVSLLEIPFWARVVGVLLCLLHGLRVWPTLSNSDIGFTALRRDSAGWHLWNERDGWQPVQLRPDSIALPNLILLRFRLMGGHWLSRYWFRSVCIPGDAMAPDNHRRLRLRLKFSRRRWAAPE